jgi:hypothetical protein
MKGQFFAYDAIIAGALFSILLALLFIYWTSIHYLVFNQVDDMYRMGLSISDILLTPGSPSDWAKPTSFLNPQLDPDNVHQVGLTDDFGSMTLNTTKVRGLQDYAPSYYDTLKEKFGSGKYDFFIKIDTQVVGGEDVEIGKPPENPTGKITITRPVVYDGGPANMIITIWMNYTI